MGSSSEDIDQATSEKQATSDDNTGIGRSYECTFCKRGFTNAQALGGHMNIHRKDKAKAKVKNHQPNKTLEDRYANDPSNSAGQYYEAQQRPYSTAMAAYMSYQLYFPSSPSNPSAGANNYLNGYNNGHHVDETGSSGLTMGPPHRAADHEEEIKNIGEVDLELRLGYQYP